MITYGQKVSANFTAKYRIASMDDLSLINDSIYHSGWDRIVQAVFVKSMQFIVVGRMIDQGLLYTVNKIEGKKKTFKEIVRCQQKH